MGGRVTAERAHGVVQLWHVLDALLFGPGWSDGHCQRALHTAVRLNELRTPRLGPRCRRVARGRFTSQNLKRVSLLP
jgi:hypothetical protein